MSLFREFASMQRQMHSMMQEMDRHFGRMSAHAGVTGMPSFFDDIEQDPFFTATVAPYRLTDAATQQQQQQQSSEFKKEPQTSTSQTALTTQPQQQQQSMTTRGRTSGSDWLSGPWGGMNRSGWLSAPAIDILQQADKYVVKADLPAGIAKENVKLDLDTNRGVLTLSGSHTHSSEQKDESAQWIRRERSSGSFTRSLRLPADVELKEGGRELSAKFDNGVLELVLPRKVQHTDPKLKEQTQAIKIE